jgi:Icc protein
MINPKKINLTNPEALWNILALHSQVQLIVFGHIHQDYSGKEQQISFFATPSTCVQLQPNWQVVTIDPIPPGYRWVDLYPDVILATNPSLANILRDFFSSISLKKIIPPFTLSLCIALA